MKTPSKWEEFITNDLSVEKETDKAVLLHFKDVKFWYPKKLFKNGNTLVGRDDMATNVINEDNSTKAYLWNDFKAFLKKGE
jgi:hypothetical protein